MPNNQIVYPSGSTLTRKFGNGCETWEFDNKSLNNAVFSLDLSSCEGITFEDGSDDVQEVKIPYLQKKDIFKLIKKSNCKFAPRFNLKENPISLEEQK